MQKKELLSRYTKKKDEIQRRLKDFSNIPQKEYIHELIFCLLTPQSQAKKCWEAVVQLKENEIKESEIKNCLSTKTRFHNNKARYIIEARKNWENTLKKIQEELEKENIMQLRNWLAENILGLGMKEASHFLRNIGKSNNQIAILDRHIIKNLKTLGVIKSITSLNKKNYLILEDKFKSFSQKINIPIDHLDLLFWSEEEGTIFK